MVSEDSDHVVSWLLTIHRFHDRDDVDESARREVSPFGDQLDALRELLEVRLFGCSQWVPLEERYDHFKQVLALANAKSKKILAMVVVATIRQEIADTEELAECEQRCDALCALRHDELMRNLESGSVALAVSAIRLSDQTDGEASFPVYKADYPAD